MNEILWKIADAKDDSNVKAKLHYNPFCQNGTFEPLHEIQNLLKHYENGDKNFFS